MASFRQSWWTLCYLFLPTSDSALTFSRYGLGLSRPGLSIGVSTDCPLLCLLYTYKMRQPLSYLQVSTILDRPTISHYII
ncbi:hypothetical protein F5Y19DRAFT_340962 [Xylariaceae sp. FL1651]|nr:hypothetical protein F5Y19DRAFT_340962 [Xylariaceae sp. FL1651]